MNELDTIIHSPLRLAVLSLLMSIEEADFMFLKAKTGATMGNLSVQLTKLADCGYIEVEKTFCNKRPRTVCRMTDKGREAFAGYVATLKSLIAPAFGEPEAEAGIVPGLVPGV